MSLLQGPSSFAAVTRASSTASQAGDVSWFSLSALQAPQGNPACPTTHQNISPEEINEAYLSTMESIATSSLKHMLEIELKVKCEGLICLNSILSAVSEINPPMI